MSMAKTTKTTYTSDEVSAAFNRACDEIAEAADLPDSGARDALNLLVNYGISQLEDPDCDLETCVAASYSGEGDEEAKLETIISWINE